MKISIDSDKNGAEFKKMLIEFLQEKNFSITDLNYLVTHENDDYPDVAVNLAKSIKDKVFDRGILICGTGQGMAMCANKVEGIFAGACTDVYSAERLVKSNNAQVLCLGALVLGNELAKMIVDSWVHSEFQGGRSLPKVERMHEIDNMAFNHSGK